MEMAGRGLILYLTRDDIIGSLVVDSDGYIYGKVSDISVEAERLGIVVYEELAQEEKKVNQERLVQELVTEHLKKTYSEKNLRELVKRVKEFKDIKTEPVLQDFVDYANHVGQPIPYEVIPGKVQRTKDNVQWDEVASISKTSLGRIILLRHPLEAERIGAKGRDRPPFMKSEDVKGKRILDNRGYYIGDAKEICFGEDGPGVLITSFSKQQKTVVDMPTLRQKISEYFKGNEREMRSAITQALALSEQSSLSDDQIFAWAKAGNFPIPTTVVESVQEQPLNLFVKWSDVDKVADVIILKHAVDSKEESPLLPLQFLNSTSK
jgi:sporulation protein YlmC with PRC-barrel domain